VRVFSFGFIGHVRVLPAEGIEQALPFWFRQGIQAQALAARRVGQAQSLRGEHQAVNTEAFVVAVTVRGITDGERLCSRLIERRQQHA